MPAPVPPPDPAAELDSLFDDPDAPLLPHQQLQPPPPPSTKARPSQKPSRLPRWLIPPPPRSRPSRVLGSIWSLVRWSLSRPTWRYVLLAAPALYVLTCVLLLQTPPFASPLPEYTGLHAVGTIDVEVALPPRLVSDSVFRESGLPAFELQTVLFTLYYPADGGDESTPRRGRSQSRHYWIPKPISLTARGYAKFAHLDNFLLRPLLTFTLWAIAGGITIPAEVDAPLLASPTPPPAPNHGGSISQFPLIVFSHGMASSRTDYTHYLGELASRGTIVAATEHRDGSCPGSLILKPPPSSPPQQRLHFAEADLLLANRSAMSTPQLKREQLAFRDAEIAATISAMQSLHANESLVSSRGEGHHQFKTFARRIDMAKLIVAGHSYGATGALQFLKRSYSSSSSADPSAPPAPAAAIILDPGKNSGPLNTQISVPILVVHSNSWSRTHSLFFGRPHFDTVRDLTRRVLRRTGAAWFLTSLGTSHPSVTDAPLLEPLLLSWTTGASLDTRAALAEYVGLSHDFVRFVVDGTPRGLLAQPVTHAEYGKWVDGEREKSFPEDLARLWEVHVSAASLDKHAA
ncbi:hypothetical protein E4U41_006812 [Claviceps citrina]|nr:hypothetical protein E4U41_006812 [Claviceps citrina]